MESQVAWELFFIYSPYLLGLPPMLLGAVVFLFGQRLPKPLRPCTRGVPPEMVRLLGGSFLVLAVMAILMACVGPWPWERYETMLRLLSSTPEDIVSVDIVPLVDFAGEHRIVRRPLIIKEHDRLVQLCDALHTAKSKEHLKMRNYGQRTWRCRMSLHQKEQTEGCVIEKTESGTVFLTFEEGGIFQCDALGTLVEAWQTQAR